jgi:pyruvate kinase
MKVIIDRFEGEYAVCEKEDREMMDIKRDSLPKEAKEGDVLYIEDDKIIVDVEETEKRKKEIEELTKDLWA